MNTPHVGDIITCEGRQALVIWASESEVLQNAWIRYIHEISIEDLETGQVLTYTLKEEIKNAENNSKR